MRFLQKCILLFIIVLCGASTFHIKATTQATQVRMDFLINDYNYEIYVFQDEENKNVWIRLQDLAYILHNTVCRFDVQQEGDFFTVVRGRSIRDRNRDYDFLYTPPTNGYEPVYFQEARVRNWVINQTTNSWLGYHILDAIQSSNDYFFNLQEMSCFLGFRYSYNIDYDNYIIIHASVFLDEPAPIPPPSTAIISDYGRHVTIEFLQDFLSLFGLGVYLDNGIMFDRGTRIFFTDEFQPLVYLLEIQVENEEDEDNENSDEDEISTIFILFDRNNELIATDEVPFYYNGLLATAFWLYYFGNDGIPDILISYSTVGWGGEILYRYIDGQFQPLQYVMNPTFYTDSEQRLIAQTTDIHIGRYQQFFYIIFTDDGMEYSYLGTLGHEENGNENNPFEDGELTQIHSLFELEEEIINYVRSNLGMIDTAVPWMHWSAVSWTEITPPSYTEEGLKTTTCIECDKTVLSQVIPMLQEEEELEIEYNKYEEINEIEDTEEIVEEIEDEYISEPEDEIINIYPIQNNSTWFSRNAITITLVILLGVVLLYQLKK